MYSYIYNVTFSNNTAELNMSLSKIIFYQNYLVLWMQKMCILST